MDTAVALDLRADFTGHCTMQVGEPNGEGHRSFTLTAGKIDKQAESYFGRGFCHWLAGAISTATGFVPLLVGIRQPGGAWVHAHTAVRTPYGNALDIFGETSIEELGRRYLGNGYTQTQVYPLDSLDMPAALQETADIMRGSWTWWAEDYRTPEVQSVLLHFARLLLTRHRYGDFIRSHAQPRPAAAPPRPAAARPRPAARAPRTQPPAANCPQAPTTGGTVTISEKAARLRLISGDQGAMKAIQAARSALSDTVLQTLSSVVNGQSTDAAAAAAEAGGEEAQVIQAAGENARNAVETAIGAVQNALQEIDNAVEREGAFRTTVGDVASRHGG
ncbi:hypothetical protein AB0M80_05635 [Amycolatopsis sp. NPDC051045]|uniref:hypothetical protein n=1 Tax=Amycolatopsis sp. NPDC051045 TaxID=3156922 RepID=UPI0034183B5B